MILKGKIVVVDDNPETLETICLMAKSMKIGEVRGFRSAKESYNFVRYSLDVEMILCDWNMPDKTGLELLQDLRKEGNLVPFVMVTARTDLNSVLQARKYGISLYISKPFSMNELQQKILWVTRNSDIGMKNLNFTDDSLQT